jgi:hypothetical protein
VTLAPVVNPTIRGVAGPPGKLGFWCATPGCGQPAQQRHHLWPKSFLRNQPYEWVEVDGLLLQNSTGLCITDHNAVTGGPGGHQAHIRWNSGLQMLEWWQNEGGLEDEWVCYGPLKDASEEILQTEAAVERVKEDLCPSCGRPSRKEPSDLPKRKTKSWTVSVPDDAEDGAAVLDEYVDDLSVALGFGDESKGVRRFHVLANVLLWVVQMKPEFLADWEDAGKA